MRRQITLFACLCGFTIIHIHLGQFSMVFLPAGSLGSVQNWSNESDISVASFLCCCLCYKVNSWHIKHTVSAWNDPQKILQLLLITNRKEGWTNDNFIAKDGKIMVKPLGWDLDQTHTPEVGRLRAAQSAKMKHIALGFPLDLQLVVPNSNKSG